MASQHRWRSKFKSLSFNLPLKRRSINSSSLSCTRTWHPRLKLSKSYASERQLKPRNQKTQRSDIVQRSKNSSPSQRRPLKVTISFSFYPRERQYLPPISQPNVNLKRDYSLKCNIRMTRSSKIGRLNLSVSGQTQVFLERITPNREMKSFLFAIRSVILTGSLKRKLLKSRNLKILSLSSRRRPVLFPNRPSSCRLYPMKMPRCQLL